MNVLNRINLTYHHEFSLKNESLYALVTKSTLSEEGKANRRTLNEAGFELMHDAHRNSSWLPSAATFHHYPSGSTVIIKENETKSYVDIIGERAQLAKDALTEIVKGYGLELREEKSGDKILLLDAA